MQKVCKVQRCSTCSQSITPLCLNTELNLTEYSNVTIHNYNLNAYLSILETPIALKIKTFDTFYPGKIEKEI